MTRMQRWMLLSDEERKLVVDLALEFPERLLWEVFDELYPIRCLGDGYSHEGAYE